MYKLFHLNTKLFLKESISKCQEPPSCYVTDSSCNTIAYILPELFKRTSNPRSNSGSNTNTNSTNQQIQFAGVKNLKILSSNSISLSWSQATSTASNSSEIEYLVYSSNTSNGQNFNIPLQVTPKGATSITISSLTANTNFYFVVRARDTSGIMDTNTNQRAALLNGLIRYIPLDSSSLSTMEKIGNQSITAQGTPLLSTTDRLGVVNNAFTLNGSSQYFEFNQNLPQVLPTGNAAKTFCAWIRTTNTANQTIVSYGLTSAQQSVFMLTQFSGYSYLSYVQPSSFQSDGTIGTFLSNGVWQFVCITNQSLGANTLTGFQINSNFSQLIRFFATNSSNGVLGRIGVLSYSLNDYFNGSISEVSIWDRALTPEELLEVYKN